MPALACVYAREHGEYREPSPHVRTRAVTLLMGAAIAQRFWTVAFHGIFKVPPGHAANSSLARVRRRRRICLRLRNPGAPAAACRGPSYMHSLYCCSSEGGAAAIASSTSSPPVGASCFMLSTAGQRTTLEVSNPAARKGTEGAARRAQAGRVAKRNAAADARGLPGQPPIHTHQRS